MRPIQTISLSSFLLNIPLFIFEDTNISQPYGGKTAIELFTNPVFNGKNVLICWEHSNIQALCDQIVRSYLYINLNSNKNMTIESLLLTSSEEWWKENSPININNRYISTFIPLINIPYQKYAELLPYWNTDNFNNVYIFSTTIQPGNLSFSIFNQNINTCYKNCELIIGMLQYFGQPSYPNEKKCIPPL